MSARSNEVAMYAIIVDTEEIYEKCIRRPDEKAQETVKEWVDFVHPDPIGRFQAFLFRTPEKRSEAWPHIKGVFQSAAIAAQVAYVDKSYLTKKGGNRQ